MSNGCCRGCCCRCWVVRGVVEGVRKLRGRSCKVRRVEDVEELRAELEVNPFGKDELLGHNQVLLEETRPVQKIALKVAELARLRHRKGRRVEDLAILVKERINTRDQVGTANVARGPAARLVDDRYAICPRPTEVEALRRVKVEDVGAGDLHGDRQATAHVHDRAQLPTGEQRLAGAGLTLTKRQRVDGAEVEGMANVEVVVAVIVSEISYTARVVARS